MFEEVDLPEDLHRLRPLTFFELALYAARGGAGGMMMVLLQNEWHSSRPELPWSPP